MIPGVDPVEAFNLLLERMDRVIASFERIAQAMEDMVDIERDEQVDE